MRSFASIKLTILALMISFALTDQSVEAQAPPYKLSFRAHKKGTYDGIRFIYIDYRGKADTKLWKEAFDKIASHYSKENITHKVGSDGNFFRINGLSNSTNQLIETRHVIVGFLNEKTKTSGYLVIYKITPTKVFYVTNQGRYKENGKDPGRFEKWRISSFDSGGNIATGSSGISIRYAAIQIWKHGKNAYDAAVAFRFRNEAQ